MPRKSLANVRFSTSTPIACHNGRMQAGNLELDSADIGDVASNPRCCGEKVVRKLRAGAMPPLPRPRPDHETYELFHRLAGS
ncbi:MAG: hypothetical protein Ct9H300mP25_00130 [Acidobacteriota bacterium]|nr:MAG: hypothetical protein Ct9H300mP25_00130 [Acidobacteriota bacterium]